MSDRPSASTADHYGNGNTNGKALANGTNNLDDLIKVQPPRREDLQPSYAQVIKPDTQDASNHGWYGSMINTLGSLVGTCGAIPCCVICPNPYKPVTQGNVGLVTKFGRFSRAVDPGLVKINPLSEKLYTVDVKIQIVEVPQQVVMTKDNVNLHLTSVIYYHITSPHKAAFGISNVRQALIERTQTTLRHVIGARVLQDVIERREEIAVSIREIIEDTAAGWGVAVESMLIKDIVFSQELQDSLSMAAQSKRTGEAKVIAARAEVESAKLMRQAADILSSAPAMQIRYLEAMQAMAKSGNSKIIFMPGPDRNLNNIAGMPIGDLQAGQSNDNDGIQDVVNARVLQDL
ncbi:membrane protease subunit, stomatin/prohibitin like protein [Myriangium duriaei CBS 260.36]|uniref:Membrane protease subunit, stomatin/prohibitin like protein n=1 Tax=Myriangium duriaei CBS 260.36 TaxID=1168546 RepID=A0A9P4JAK4_9PEZI|nr:membrane protease subunit, stomatin/prohibitin like protein [Myriangium duriaei CBS 260.36]